MRALLTLLAIGGFLGFILWDLQSQGTIECDVCVEFKGRTRCATGSASTRQEALRSAQTPACQLLINGVTDAFACSATQPVTARCTGDE